MKTVDESQSAVYTSVVSEIFVNHGGEATRCSEIV